MRTAPSDTNLNGKEEYAKYKEIENNGKDETDIADNFETRKKIWCEEFTRMLLPIIKGFILNILVIPANHFHSVWSSAYSVSLSIGSMQEVTEADENLLSPTSRFDFWASKLK